MVDAASFNIAGIFSALNLPAVGQMFLTFLLVVGLILLVGGGLFFLWWRSKNKDNKKDRKFNIIWWEELENRLEPNPSPEEVEEIAMPNSPLTLFYSKRRDMWLPRFNRSIRKGLYYVAKTRNGELVNFVLTGITLDATGTLGYDHTDMRWAAENARDFVKRNFKDKSQKWWQLYKGPITTAIYIFVITFSLIILLIIAKGTFDHIGQTFQVLITGLNDAIGKLSACSSAGLKPGV